MFTEAYLGPSQISMMDFFSLWLSDILKMYLIRSNWFKVPFFTQLLFWEKLSYENFRRKSLLLTLEQFFFKT